MLHGLIPFPSFPLPLPFSPLSQPSLPHSHPYPLHSHEIRTPLNITAVGMDTMQRTLKKMPPSKLTGFLQEIVDSCSVACEDALTIVSELLDFEKLAAGR